jgi:hypothetical protein
MRARLQLKRALCFLDQTGLLGSLHYLPPDDYTHSWIRRNTKQRSVYSKVIGNEYEDIIIVVAFQALSDDTLM